MVEKLDKDWFNNQFIGYKGDRWGHDWKGSQKLRHTLCLNIIKNFTPIKLIKHLTILDIGCALGDFTKKIYDINKDNSIFGIDISDVAIHKVSQMYPLIDFRVCNLPYLSFSENSFNIISALEVIGYLSEENRSLALKNIKNILKKDGYFLFSAKILSTERFFDKNEAIKMISTYFDIIRIDYNYAYYYKKFEKLLLNFKIFKGFFRMLLSSEIIAKIFNFITKFILKENGLTHIFILAKNDK